MSILQRRKLERLEKIIGYHFKNPEFLEEALIHPSYAKEMHLGKNNQRLEFLGDSILSAILAEALFELYPSEREGFLARAKAALGKGIFLAELAQKLKFYNFAFLSKKERQIKGHKRESTLEDALEAVIGAIFLDAGYDETRQVVLGWLRNIDGHLERVFKKDNPKGKLQERYFPKTPGAQRIEYCVDKTKGDAHERIYYVSVYLDGEFVAQGKGASKKKAEEDAASKALKKSL